MLTEIVSFEIARLLNNAVNSDWCYAAQDNVQTTSDFGKHSKGELIDKYRTNIMGDVFDAPTYAELLDFLTRRYGIFVEFIPWHTFALKERVAYTYKVYRLDKKEGTFEKILESDEWIASQRLCTEEIVKYIVENVKD